MSKIRKLNGNEWKIFAETNDQKIASKIYTDDPNKTVQQVLNEQSDSIAKLKKNVAWLALHGGGGGGGGGSGSSSKTASMNIEINTKPSGSEIPMTVDESSTLNISMSNIKPKNMQSAWDVQVTIGNDLVCRKTVNEDPSSIVIDNDTIKKYIVDSVTGESKRSYVVVNASYKDDVNFVNGTSQWRGYIYKSSIETITQYYVNENQTNKILQSQITGSQSEIRITTKTALVGNFDIEISLYDSNGNQIAGPILDTFDKPEGTEEYLYSKKLDDIYSQFKSARYSASVQVKHQSTDVTGKNSSYFYVFDKVDSLIVTTSGLSFSAEYPIQVSNITRMMTLTIDAQKYNDSSNDKFHYRITAKNDSEEIKLIVYEIDQQCDNVSDKVPYGTIQTVNLQIPRSIHDNDTYILDVRVKDILASEQYEIKCQDSYIKVIDDKNSYYDFPSKIKDSTLFNINASTNINYNNDHNTVVSQTSTGTVSCDVEIYNRNVVSKVITEGRNSMIRLGSECYMTIDDTFKTGETVQRTLQSSNVWQIDIAFRSDEYLDDNHLVFAYGRSSDGSKGTAGDITNGISIKVHGIYIKNSLVIPLNANVINIINIVYSNVGNNNSYWNQYVDTNSNTHSYIKIYVNGVMSYVSNNSPFEIVSGQQYFRQCKFYIGGTEYGQYCNCYIYGINAYSGMRTISDIQTGNSELFGELDILASFINNKIRTDIENSSTIKTTLTSRNLCTQSKENNTIESQFIDKNGYNFQMFFIKDNTDGYRFPINDAEYDTKKSTFDDLKHQLSGVSLVLLDVSSNDKFTFQNFIRNNYKDSSEAPSGRGEMYYWDISNKNVTYSIKVTDVTIGIQGTSTINDKIKNVDIELNGQDDRQDLLYVNESWLPEKKYVFKADIVDSSHSNNASIGKYINQNFGYNFTNSKLNEFGFGFDENAIAKVRESRSGSKVSNGTIKHTVEGFPTLMFMKFHAETNPRLIGIMSMNLGRQAYNNLGYTSIKIKNEQQQVSIPCILKDVEVEKNIIGESYWMEVKETSNIENDQFSKLSASLDTGFKTKGGGSFWSANESLVNHKFEIEYDSDNTPGNTASKIMSAFIDQITKLPVEGVCKSQIQYPGVYETTDIFGTYTDYKYTNQGYEEKGSVKIEEKIDTDSFNQIDIDHAYKYFCLALLFGLTDNFEKNIAYRRFNSSSPNSKWMTEFYDLDTALGITNQGQEKVNASYWIKYLTNQFNSETNGYIMDETYDINNSLDQQLNPLKVFTPESYSNKLWLSIDGKSVRTALSRGGYSCYSSNWFELRNIIDKIAYENGKATFVDHFMDNYFNSHLENIGSLLINYDYRMKYLNVYESDGSGVSNVGNTLSKLHGKRDTNVRKWLTDRISFLDSFFIWRNSGQYIQTSTIEPSNIKSDLNKQISLTTNGSKSSSPYIPIISNRDIVVASSSAGSSIYGYTLLKKNVLTNVPIKNGVGVVFIISNLPSIAQIDITNVRPTTIKPENYDENFSQFLEFKLIDCNISESGFQSNHLYFNDKSMINTLVIKNCQFVDSIDIDISKLNNVLYLDISGSKNISISNIDKASFKKLILKGSGITTFEIKNQHRVEIPSLEGCDSINKFNVEQSDLSCIRNPDLSCYKDIVFDGYPLLTEINLYETDLVKSLSVVNCNNLTSININKCKKLSSIVIDGNISLIQDDSVKIVDAYDLKTLKITNQNINTFTFDSDNLSDLVELNLSSSVNITHIKNRSNNSTTFDGYPILDLGKFNSLVKFNAFGLGQLSAIRFPNLIDKPFDTTGFRFGYYDTSGELRPETDWELSSLRRVFGNIKITSHSFRNCTNFTLGSKQDWDMKDISKTLYDTNFSSLGYLSSNINQNTLYYKGEQDFNKNEFATNIICNSLHTVMTNTMADWADLYYLIHRVSMYNSVKDGKVTTIYYPATRTGEETIFSNWQTLPSNLFIGLSDITSIDHICDGNSTITNSTMQKLTNLETLHDLTDKNRFDNTLFNRNDGKNYKISYIGSFVDSQNLDMSTGFLSSLTKLKTITNSFRANIIDVQNIRLPNSVEHIENSFNGKSNGTLDPGKMFLNNDVENNLEKVLNSFNFTDINIEYRPSSFSKFTNLKYIGTTVIDNDVDAFNGTTNKYICKESEDGEQYSTNDWNQFCSQFLYGLSNLVITKGLLENARIKGTKDPNLSITLPLNMFHNNTRLQSVKKMFYNFREKYSLSPEGFINCPNIQNVSQMFKQYRTTKNNIEIPTNQYGITSDIPFKMFYHGGQMCSDFTISGVYSDSPPVSYTYFNTLMENATHNTTIKLSNIVIQCWLSSQEKYERLSSNHSEEFEKIQTQYPIYNIESLQEFEQYRPFYVYNNQLLCSQASSIASTLMTIKSIIKSSKDNWLSDIIELSTDTMTRIGFNNNIKYIYECFYGNGMIKEYSGKTVTEPNNDYNPFNYTLTSSNSNNLDSSEVNTFRLDDQWSYNGEISAISSDGQTQTVYFTIDETHNNCCSRDDQPLESIFKTDDNTYKTNGYNTTGAQKELFEIYNRTNDTHKILKFMCSPDLLRYCTTDVELNYLFAKGSSFYWGRHSGPQHHTDYGYIWEYFKEYDKSTGIKGRIPRILFKPVKDIRNVNGVFCQCKQITGFKNNGLNYIVPKGIFKENGKLTSFVKTFAELFIPYHTELSDTFIGVYSASDTKLDTTGMFGGCMWQPSKIETRECEYESEFKYSKIANDSFFKYANGMFSKYHVIHNTESKYNMNEYRSGSQKSVGEDFNESNLSIDFDGNFLVNTEHFSYWNNKYIYGIYAGWDQYPSTREFKSTRDFNYIFDGET